MPRAFLVKKAAARVAYGVKAPSVPISRWSEELLGRGKEIRRFLEIDKDPNDATETRDSEIRGLRDMVSQVIENGHPPPLPISRWRFISTGSGATEVERDSVQDPASEQDGGAIDPRDPPLLESRSKTAIKRLLIGLDEEGRLAPDSSAILAPLPLSVIQPVRGFSSTLQATGRQAFLFESLSRFRCRRVCDCFCSGPSLSRRPATENSDGRMESRRKKKSPDVAPFPTVSCTSLGVSGASFAKAPPVDDDDDDASIVGRYHFSKLSTSLADFCCSSFLSSSCQNPLESETTQQQGAVGSTEVTYRARPEAPRFQCEACRKSYSTSNGLSRHREFHCSTNSKRTFACPHCDGKYYGTFGALKMHIRTHTLPCRCRVCGKAFSRPWLLQGHLRTHTGEKPFECQHCRRAFADRSNLRAHLQTHAVTKRYKCRSCARTFSRMSLLMRHKQNSCSNRDRCGAILLQPAN